MSQFPDSFGQPQSRPLDYAQPTAGAAVATFFNAVYAWMCAGLALTAVVAYWTSTQPDVINSVGKGFWALVIVELVLVGVISAAVNRINAAVATVLFLVYAALNGLTLAGIFFMYTHATLASAFAVTAGTFGAMSLYGMFTKKDLTQLGGILFMLLVGLVIASLVSIFWHPTMLTVAINYIGVLIFVGLTAYDTQRLKYWAIQTAGNHAFAQRLAVNGALSLYLDFLNLFLFMLQILGGNRNSR